jgi:predicted transposase/invertase (TIGR01784 family)
MSINEQPAPGKYIDPLVDFAFKKIFGSEPNKDLLIAFLNEVFRGRKHITSLVYNKNEYPGDLKEEGAAIFDLLCTGANGEQFLIEIQRGATR